MGNVPPPDARGSKKPLCPTGPGAVTVPRKGCDMHERTGIRLTVRGLLDAPLRTPRVRSLEQACDRLAAQPLAETLADLRQVTANPITTESCRRLHVLISALYHRAGAPLALTEELRAEAEAAKAAPTQGAITMSCSNPDCRKMGCSTEPQPTPTATGRE